MQTKKETGVAQLRFTVPKTYAAMKPKNMSWQDYLIYLIDKDQGINKAYAEQKLKEGVELMIRVAEQERLKEIKKDMENKYTELANYGIEKAQEARFKLAQIEKLMLREMKNSPSTAEEIRKKYEVILRNFTTDNMNETLTKLWEEVQ